MIRAMIGLVAVLLWCSFDCRVASSQASRSGVSTTHNRRPGEAVSEAADYEAIPVGWISGGRS